MPLQSTRPKNLGLLALLGILTLGGHLHAAEPVAARRILIPQDDHGYENFESVVITSQAELDQFLAKGSRAKDYEWNEREKFEKALADANLDFEGEALVLFHHTEGSGSIDVRLRIVESKGKRIVCRIDRSVPQIQTDDLATHGFALAVNRKRVRSVEIRLHSETKGEIEGRGLEEIILEYNFVKYPRTLEIPGDEASNRD